ncbi:MAG: hypothetical protein KF869_11160 [Phycisphaeraceae bacterium]|nr:hypothetical protein [Phycisphaeraceae bacterium]
MLQVLASYRVLFGSTAYTPCTLRAARGEGGRASAAAPDPPGPLRHNGFAGAMGSR